MGNILNFSLLPFETYFELKNKAANQTCFY